MGTIAGPLLALRWLGGPCRAVRDCGGVPDPLEAPIPETCRRHRRPARRLLHRGMALTDRSGQFPRNVPDAGSRSARRSAGSDGRMDPRRSWLDSNAGSRSGMDGHAPRFRHCHMCRRCLSTAIGRFREFGDTRKRLDNALAGWKSPGCSARTRASTASRRRSGSIERPSRRTLNASRRLSLPNTAPSSRRMQSSGEAGTG